MLKQSRPLAALLLTLLLAAFPLPASAHAEVTFPATFTISKAEARRFACIMLHTYANDPWWIGRGRYSNAQLVEDTEAWLRDDPKGAAADPDFIRYGLPGPLDMSSDTAVMLSYKAVILTANLDDAALALFYPYATFDMTDPDNPVWMIELASPDLEVYDQYGAFQIRVQARTRVVQSCYWERVAVG